MKKPIPEQYKIQIDPRIRGGYSWVVQKNGEMIYFGTSKIRENAEKTARYYVRYSERLQAHAKENA